MILSIGEILADLVGTEENGVTVFRAHPGGAPFNFAVCAKRAGAEVGFVGRIGDDPVGRFLLREAEEMHLDLLALKTDPERNTTLAFVTLSGGERDFAFFRRDTADTALREEDADLSDPRLSTVHIGSLMLADARGLTLASSLLRAAHEKGLRVTFDINYRADLFPKEDAAREAYRDMICGADILKFSEDELFLFTGIRDIPEATRALGRAGLTVVTAGERGAYFRLGDVFGEVPTTPRKPIDTTGAGDAFFGTLVASLDGKELTPDTVRAAVVRANIAGGDATQHEGAIV